MKNIDKALQILNKSTSGSTEKALFPFEEYIKLLHAKPESAIRNVFQIFHDMVKNYVDEGVDEYSDDPESIHFLNYDCSRLFVEGSDRPFLADRLFANRLVRQVEALKRGAQQNKIYIFYGPPGCGKSTFLNNLLKKFEEYANIKEGLRYETVWRLDRKILGDFRRHNKNTLIMKLYHLLEAPMEEEDALQDDEDFLGTETDYIDVPCPSHDHPILMIPKIYRRDFFDALFDNHEFKEKLFTEKEYEWVFSDVPCTICSSIYQALSGVLKSSGEVYKMIYAQPYRFNRRLGEGISVFNPGDKPVKQNILKNELIQKRINSLFKERNTIRYLYSRYAKTNNGVYALMDIKSHNTDRLIELHNIVSEGVHKVEDIEESVNSLLVALMNPEDKKNIQNIQSFSDRIEYINIPYVLDHNTEVEIYRNIFGRQIDENFLPRVLHNFARVVISTRLNKKSEGMLEWIENPKKYSLYCDENLHLLKMELYTGLIPTWLSEEDRKRLTAKRRRNIISESEKEGASGFSGRDSIRIFNEFYSPYAKSDRPINMSNLCDFFTKFHSDLKKSIPEGFLDSLLRMYNYTVLEEVKESLYYYNEEQISKDIKHYMFAINFEIGSVETCNFTGEKLEITNGFIQDIENRLLGAGSSEQKRIDFRNATQKEYTSKTLTKEIMLEGKPIVETELYQSLYSQYEYNIKEKVLDPFLENENFRRAIKDYNKDDFKTYDEKIRNDVTFLMNNLCRKFNYTEKGAQAVCIYVIDNELGKSFSDN
jgi:predicted Ser/Thr protein kinase